MTAVAEHPQAMIAGQWTSDTAGGELVSVNPADGIVIGRIRTISVNSYSEGDMTVPFGGFRQSGFGGKEKSMAAFDQRTQTKTVWIQTH